jgi:hypothetical protein
VEKKMAQNISDTNNFTTNYDVGVPEQTDVANIIQAFTEYHYGADYDGNGDPGGMEGHLAGIEQDLSTHASSTTGVHGVESGNLVGTTSTQTLTNKTLSSATLSSPTITGTSTVTGDFNVTGTFNVTESINVTGDFDVQSVRESLSSELLSAGTLTIDYATGANVSLSSPSANFSIDAINVPLDNDKVINITIIVTQGSTGGIPSAFNINGSAQTIRWVAGITPTPTANKIDIFSFTLIRQSSSWTVLAQASLNF